jgi:peroxiredoxin
MVLFSSGTGFVLAQSKNAHAFTLIGQLPRPIKGKVSLLNQENSPIYSAVVNGTRFVLKGILAEPGLYELKLDTMTITYPVFVEATTMQISIQDAGAYQVKGSKLHDQYEQYITGFIDPIRNRLMELTQKRSVAKQEGDTILYNKLYQVSDSIGRYYADTKPGLINKKPYTYFNLHLLQQYNFDDSVQVKFLNELRPSLGGFPSFKQMEQAIKTRAVQREKIGEGREAYSFTLPDSSGVKHSLAMLRKSNKLILLDFWASWCGPCIKEFPNLMALQKKYGKRGLQVVGISVDSSPKPWIRALKKHTPIGLQLLSTNKGLVFDNYAIHTIPQTILIDQDGKIISTGLQGEVLAEKVATLLQETR